MIYLVTSTIEYKGKNAWIVDAENDIHAKTCVTQELCEDVVYAPNEEIEQAIKHVKQVIKSLTVESLHSNVIGKFITKRLLISRTRACE